MAENYYQVLGLQPEAGEAEIREAYKRLAKQWHPDVNPHKAEAEEKFKLINEAYSTLSDRTKRAYYDLSLFSTAFEEAIQQTPNTRRAPRTQSTRRRPPISPDWKPPTTYFYSWKTKLLTWLFLATIIPAFFGLVVGWANYSSYRLKNEAEEAFNKQNYTEAAQLYRRAGNMVFVFNNGESLYKAAMIFHEKLHQPGYANEMFYKTLRSSFPKTNVERSEILQKISLNFFLLGNYNRAEQSLMKAFYLGEGNIDLNLEFGMLHELKHKDYEKALDNYSSVSPTHPEQELLTLRTGSTLYSLERYEEARTYFEKMYSANPREGLYAYLIANCYLEEGDTTEACRFFRLSAKENYKNAFISIIDHCE